MIWASKYPLCRDGDILPEYLLFLNKSIHRILEDAEAAVKQAKVTFM